MKKKTFTTFFIILASAFILSFATVSDQVNTLGFHFVKNHQEREHNKLLEGHAGNPWQYRILADYMLEPLIHFFQGSGMERPKPRAFILFRFIQNIFIFIAASYYYKKLGLPILSSLLGVSILAWMMSQGVYDSDLTFNTYFDLLFYLIAVILLLTEKYLWLLPLMVLAAFNRETCGLMIILLPAYIIFYKPQQKKDPRVYIATLGMAILYTTIFFGLRSYFGEQEFLTAFGNFPGKRTLYFNVVNLFSWQRILITVGLIPFLAVFSYPKWIKPLKIFFWVIVPVWGTIHFLASVVAETRLFLVPLAVIFIPAILFGTQKDKTQTKASSLYLGT
jgi:hypothetical protein